MIFSLRKIKVCLSPLEKKFYCVFVLLALVASIIIAYWQYQLVIKDISDDIDYHIVLSREEFHDSFETYDSILKIICSKISRRDRTLSHTYVSELLKQFYITAKGQYGMKINFLDINWHGNKDNPINRYGTIPEMEFPQDAEKHIRTYPSQAYLFNVPLDNKVPPSYNVFLTVGVINNKKEYVGKLTFLLDFGSWMNELSRKINSSGLIAILVDEKQNILFSSSKALVNFITIQLPNKLEETNDSFIQPINLGDYRFTNYLVIEPYNYKLLYGYEKNFFNNQVLTRSIPLLTVLWGAASIFILFQLFYKRYVKASIKQEFINNIDTLSGINATLLKEKEEILNKLSQQLVVAEKYNNLLGAVKISEQEKEKLGALISNRILLSLIELKEGVRVLMQNVEGRLNIVISQDQQHKLLTNMFSKLEYLSLGCLAKENTSNINLKIIINDTLKLFAQEILENNLSLKVNITKINKDFRFDEILLRQLLANLLKESISCSKPEGEIKIYASTKQINTINNLILTIKDNGYGISNQYFINDNEIPFIRSSSPLMLELDIIKDIVEHCGGLLNIEYTIGQGKLITLHLPYLNNSSTTIIGNNVVPLKKG